MHHQPDPRHPNGKPAALLEPSFADALTIVAGATDLSEQVRRHWICSLRQVAKALDMPLELVPARWSAIRTRVGQLHHAPLGLIAKTLANHRSNTKAALLWLHKERHVPAHGAPLSAEWGRLKARLDREVRWRLSPLMRYCSGRGIAPEQVNEEVIDGYMEYRGRSTARRSDDAARRVLARLWNLQVGRVAGWPARRLLEPPVKIAEGPAWEDFPEGLRQDIEQYLKGLTRIRRSKAGQRLRPCQPSTIMTRRRELAAAARMAVKIGVPIETLISLGVLLDPDVVEKVLDAYWKQNGETPKGFTIDLACHLVSIARQIRCLDEHGYERLDEMRASLESYRQKGLTDKNLALVRKVLTEGVWSRIVKLPWELMAIARSQSYGAPVRAAVTAQLAVAIAIETFAPVRLGNLAAIRLEHNLIKPGGPNSKYWLVFPDYDVKNRVKLEYPLNGELSKLLDEYVHDFRPSLVRGSNEPWFFPGQKGGAKNAISFSTQIVKKIHKATGIRITVHQFRHAAGALILKHDPGNYEFVRRLLGHRSIQTTIDFYCGLENIQASERFGDIVLEQLKLGSEAA
jgi:integrase